MPVTTLPPVAPAEQPPPAAPTGKSAAKADAKDIVNEAHAQLADAAVDVARESAEGLKSAMSRIRFLEDEKHRAAMLSTNRMRKQTEVDGYEAEVAELRAKIKAGDEQIKKWGQELDALNLGLASGQPELPFMGQGETPHKGTAAQEIGEGLDMDGRKDREDFNKLALKTIGLTAATAKKFVAGGIDNGEKLMKWLTANPRPEIKGVKDQDAARAMQMMESWFDKKRIHRESKTGPLKPGRNSIVGEKADAERNAAGEERAAGDGEGNTFDDSAVDPATVGQMTHRLDALKDVWWMLATGRRGNGQWVYQWGVSMGPGTGVSHTDWQGAFPTVFAAEDAAVEKVYGDLLAARNDKPSKSKATAIKALTSAIDQWEKRRDKDAIKAAKAAAQAPKDNADVGDVPDVPDLTVKGRYVCPDLGPGVVTEVEPGYVRFLPDDTSNRAGGGAITMGWPRPEGLALTPESEPVAPAPADEKTGRPKRFKGNKKRGK